MIDPKTGKAIVNFILPPLAEAAKIGITVLAGTGIVLGGFKVARATGNGVAKVSTQVAAKARNLFNMTSSNAPRVVEKVKKTASKTAAKVKAAEILTKVAKKKAKEADKS